MQRKSGFSTVARNRMVQRLVTAGIRSTQVLHVMNTVERHHFVDSALVNQAYEDISLPIGLEQTISKPSIVARMTELLLDSQSARQFNSGGGRKLGRVLEIGTGCGYQAAVLAHLAHEVHTIERLRTLHAKARENLRPLRLTNVHLIVGDGIFGCPEGAPYDGILCTASGTSLPPQWCEQLVMGGRLIMPVAPNGKEQQVLLVVDKTPQGLLQTVLESVHFVPLKSGVV